MGGASQTLEAGLDHHRAGRLEQAEKVYRRLLDQQPNHADALHLLGLVAYQHGESEKAVDLIRQAIAHDSRPAVFYENLGKILHDAGSAREAVECFREWVSRRPAEPQARYHLGLGLHRCGELRSSAAALREALDIQPDFPAAAVALGLVLNLLGKPGEAEQALRRAERLHPESQEVLLNLGVALQEEGRYGEAAEIANRVLRLNPQRAEAHHNLGVIRRGEGHLEEAARCYREALRLAPGAAVSWSGLGAVLMEQGQLEEAIRALEEALRLQPDFSLAHSDLLFCRNHLSHPQPAELLAAHRRWEAQHGAPFAGPRTFGNDPDPDRPLRIGYVSPDFRTHSVAFFFGPLLAAHDRARFACYCYSSVARPDAVTRQLQDLAAVWRDIRHLSDERAADLIREDRIDILVDLAGHTNGHRLLVFARRPAPVQVTYLGYPNTTGLAAIDYRLTDAWADPPGEADHANAEQLWRLPGGFLCYQPFSDAPPVEDLPALATGLVTFGSFNKFSKINSEVVAAWAAILRGVDGARMLIKAKALEDAATRERLLREFARHGVPPERLTLLAHLPNLAHHLNVYNQVDIALDTFPYNGTTTTCEALWMGVPVVTCTGPVHASRVGASLLSRLELEELVADSPQSYVATAIRAAQDLTSLRQKRAGLRDRIANSPLTDSTRFGREVEDAYREMWRQWCLGVEPKRPVAAVLAGVTDPAAELRAGVASFPYWYHRIELPGGVVTPGWAPIQRDTYRIPADLTGQRVLDVGAWDGFWSFEALKRGAREVVAIDDFSDLLGSLARSDRRAWATFDFCRAALGYAEDRCCRHEMSVYDVSADRLGRFDVVFCFGTLYHLRHPLLALDRLSVVCDGEIYVESAILDDYSPYRGGLGHGYPEGQMVAEFYPDSQYGNNPSNWWAPTLICLAHLVRAAGWAEIEAWKLTDRPAHVSVCRGFVRGRKTPGS